MRRVRTNEFQGFSDGFTFFFFLGRITLLPYLPPPPFFSSSSHLPFLYPFTSSFLLFYGRFSLSLSLLLVTCLDTSLRTYVRIYWWPVLAHSVAIYSLYRLSVKNEASVEPR